MRRITARSLRGLAHPLRMTMLEALELDGPATSSTLAQRLGENTGTISWHLRLLAEHGYIEEDTERGTKRERWWRVPPEPTVLDPAEFRDDPETSGALRVYLQHLVQRYYARVQAYVDQNWPGEWQHAAALSDWRDLRLSPDQLTALNDEIAAVIDRYTKVEPGQDAKPVIVQLQSFPRTPEPAAATEADNADRA
ncbi:transcriptional regulator [Kribbella sp. ALI-6-A]|uniref:winged helix-turn-helix domain-containing protein n=1 Tax=Kribbella sp. ALI-6-A TaxID=1933817 RepID=UPI00097CB447|nr:helix-turn-helix domain-containing protein [Kribbella sp. ALI-6-A]ONI76746.1 transcriptional regulator [Kribbella sp. ALI-6-A]